MAWLVALLTSACTGAALPDDGVVGGPETAGNPRCVEVVTQVDLDEVTTLDVTAADTLRELEGEFVIALDWRDTSDLYATHSRAGTQTSLTLRVAHDKEPVTFIESTGGRCPGPGIGAPCTVCESRFVLGLDLELSTEDQSLVAVVFNGKLVSRGKGGRLSTQRTLAKLQGSFLDDITLRAGRAATALSLEAGFGSPMPGSKRFDPNGWNGFVALTLEGKAGSPVMVAHGYWPAL